MTTPRALGDGQFDAAACSFGLSDIDDLDAAITAISGALRPRKYFVFSILHPCSAGGKDISGSWPTTGSYYDEGRWTAQDARSTLRRQVGASHRMLSTYLSTLRRHGLWLDLLAEPPPEPDWDQATMPIASPFTSWPGLSSDPQADSCTAACAHRVGVWLAVHCRSWDLRPVGGVTALRSACP